MSWIENFKKLMESIKNSRASANDSSNLLSSPVWNVLILII
jgi:hypothetical protein